MAIVEQTVHYNRQKGPDQRKVYFKFTDDNGKDYIVGPRFRPLSYDPSTDLAAEAAKLEAELETNEAAEIHGIAENNALHNRSADYMTRLLAPELTTSKVIAKRLIRWMMRERDPRIVIALEPLIDYLRTNYTAQQLATFLDMTSEEVTRVNTRINRILDHQTDIELFIGSEEVIGG